MNHWFSLNLEPGKHTLSSKNKKELGTVVTVAPGETIYVELTSTVHDARGAVRFIEVDPKEAQDKIAKIQPLNEKTGNKP
jgi:endonuclease YncB( thermonuclease family)